MNNHQTFFFGNVIETERLRLKELNPENLNQLFSGAHTDEYIIQVLGLLDLNSLDHEKRRHKEGRTTYYTTFKNFLIETKSTGRIIGYTGFHIWYFYHFRAELGYFLYNQEHMGKGYMTEANNAVINHGFLKMGLKRIEAFTAPNNLRSIKLLEKSGFKKEGIMRSHYYKNGEMEDSLVYSLLFSDFMSVHT